MKKVFLIMAVAAALVSCQSKTNNGSGTDMDSISVDVLTPVVENFAVYEGTLPATATSPAINYLLTLDIVADANDTVYTLDMVYLDANQQPTADKKSVAGKSQLAHKTMKDAKKKPVKTKTMKLTPNDGSAPTYFVVTNDTTLTLMTDSLQESISDMGFQIFLVQ